MSETDSPDATMQDAREPSARPLGVRRTLDPGRLGVYSTMGAIVGVVPLPWIPTFMARQLRGALVQDLAARHGLSLSLEARDVLSEPESTEWRRGLLGQATNFVSQKLLRRLGPAALLMPLRSALGTYVLGRLVNRYFEQLRTEASSRVDVDEARRLRRAIDRALFHALTARIQRDAETPTTLEDPRDPLTQVVDKILSRTAGLPGWLVARLDGSFDELLRPAQPSV